MTKSLADAEQSAAAFAEQASLSPPIPSNEHYDAKLWAHILERGRAGDLWWNVGP